MGCSMSSREDLILELYGPLPPAPLNSTKWKRQSEGAWGSVAVAAIVVMALGGFEAGLAVAGIMVLFAAIKSWMRGN